MEKSCKVQESMHESIFPQELKCQKTRPKFILMTFFFLLEQPGHVHRQHTQTPKSGIKWRTLEVGKPGNHNLTLPVFKSKVLRAWIAY